MTSYKDFPFFFLNHSYHFIKKHASHLELLSVLSLKLMSSFVAFMGLGNSYNFLSHKI